MTDAPGFGWAQPVQTDTPCPNPQLEDSYKHKTYLIPVRFDDSDVAGFDVKRKCDGCGRLFDYRGFLPLSVVEHHFSDVLERLEEPPDDIPSNAGDLTDFYEEALG